jgi:putative permease
VPERHREASGRSLARTQEQMTAWAKATLINGAITGLSTGLLLHFIGVQPALVFGVLAFFGEFVPNIGPLIASVPALFVALGIGPNKFAFALAAIIFVQQIESNLLVPFIMGRSMQLHPVTIVFFALAMGSLLGVVGAILAVPAAAITNIFWDEFYLQPQRHRSASLEQVEERANDLVAGQGWSGKSVGA